MTRLSFTSGLTLAILTMAAGPVLAQSQQQFGVAPQTQSLPTHPTGALKILPEVLAKIPTAPDYRAFRPVAVDLSNYFPAIGDQGHQGSCVAWSTGFAARAYYAEVVEHRDISDPHNIPSPAFIYDVIHQAGPNADDPCGGGSSATDALTLMEQGVGSLADFPYDGRDAADACPTLSAADRAKGTDFKIAGFEKLTTPEQVKSELAQGNPVIVGADIDDDFQYMQGPTGAGVWNAGRPDPKAPYEGHEFVLIGYDDQLQEFKFINSWSAEWGQNGFGRISYQTALNRFDEPPLVMRMPGDPQITLAPADFRSDVLNTTGPVLQTGPNVGSASAHGPVELSGLWCGKVEVRKGAGGKLVATGFVGAATDIDAIKVQIGADADVSGVEVAPWPLCETRLTLGDRLGGDSAPTTTIAAATDGAHAVTLSAPAAKYVYAVSFDKDGTVHDVAGLKPAGTIAATTLSGLADKDAQSLLVVASDTQLIDGFSDGESLRDFLSSLRDGVLHSGAQHISAKLVTTLDQ